MSFYNIYIEDIFGEKVYLLAIDEDQLNRLVTAFLSGQETVYVKGSNRKLNENKSFIIYSITGYDMEDKTQEQIERQLNKEKRFFNQGKLSLAFYKKYGTNITDKFTNGLGFGESMGTVPKPKIQVAKIHGKIFISHSTKNKEIVSKFCDLILGLGLNINTSVEVFNTSLEGSKPKTGEDFRNRILDELKTAKVVLQFISKEYRDSGVCMNEMGAAWVLSSNVKPLIIEKDEYDIGFIHSTNQQAQLNNETDIFRLIDELKEEGIIGDFKTERLTEKIKDFVSWLKSQVKNKEEVKPIYKKVVSRNEPKPLSQNIFSLMDHNPFYKINKLASLS